MAATRVLVIIVVALLAIVVVGAIALFVSIKVAFRGPWFESPPGPSKRAKDQVREHKDYVEALYTAINPDLPIDLFVHIVEETVSAGEDEGLLEVTNITPKADLRWDLNLDSFGYSGLIVAVGFLMGAKEADYRDAYEYGGIRDFQGLVAFAAKLYDKQRERGDGEEVAKTR